MRVWRLMLLLALQAIVLSNTRTNSTCPSKCICPVGQYTFECVQCLQTFYRTYDVATQLCPCMKGFIEKNPALDFCCPFNCSSCTDEGCVRCPVNFLQTYSTYLEVYVCICENNYYYDAASKDCICLSHTSPTNYYQNVTTDQCFQCPQGCSCNASGCYRCTSNLRRAWVDYSGKWTCPCLSPYEDTYAGCTLYSGCNITTMTCDSLTNRQYKNGRFQCIPPYTQQDGLCACLLPYIIDPNNLTSCVCSSRYSPTKYYSFADICYRCVEGCICDEKGCIYCDANLNRLVQWYACSCQPPYFMFNGSCNCTEPYYKNDAGTCQCLSFHDPAKYVYQPTRQTCYPCPAGCTCDVTGCHDCAPGTLRNVVNISGFFNCSCMNLTQQVNNVCKCQPYAELHNGQCVCFNSPQVYNDNGRCKSCPSGCTCDPTSGCISCQSAAMRTIVSANSYTTCPCTTNYTEDQIGMCICMSPYEMVNGTCVCPTPPIIIGIPLCLCNSYFDSTNYYENRLQQLCVPCPLDCTCDENGCHDCADHTLRYNVVIDGYEECPCVQNSSYYNGLCTICFNNSYYYSGICVDCPTCKTCNIKGCTSCNLGVIWNSTALTCSCADPNMTVMNGVCQCGPGFYSSGGVCVVCPNNCLTCINAISCISCRINVRRYNSPATNCPCESGYIEMGKTQSFCCPRQCLNCTIDAKCIACPTFSNRELKNGSCVCVNNLISSNTSIACICPPRMYLFNTSCMLCPLNCYRCALNHSSNLVYCLDCQPGMNRVLNATLQCPCIDNFKQSNPVLDYCYPTYCRLPTRLCSQCESPRIVLSGGLSCGCSFGYFLNTYGDCLPCNMSGCLECTALNLCLQCNETSGYFMTNYTCKSIIPPNANTYLALQHQDGIHVVIRSNVSFSEFNEVYSIYTQLEAVISNPIPTQPIVDAVDLQVINYSLIQPNVLVIHMSNPVNELKNYLLCISYVLIQRVSSTAASTNISWNGTDSKGDFLALYQTAYIYRNFTYSNDNLNVISNTTSILTFFFTGVTTIICLVLYVLGFKHNQTPFFLQTLSFISFTYSDPNLDLIPFLYNLRFSYYSFNKNMIWLLPNGYYETSTGNFPILTIDSNILRVGSITLLIAILVTILTIILRAFYEIYVMSGCIPRRKLLRLVKSAKKPVYRSLQFFYKTCMFPILFLSMIEFSNWNSAVIVGEAYFRNICHALAIFSVSAYTCVTIFQIFFESISKLYRMENAIEFLTALAAAVIITYSPDNKLFLILILVYFARALLYIISRLFYLRDFNHLEYIRFGSFALESCSLCLVMVGNRMALASITFITMIVQIGHSIVVLIFTYKRAQRAKRDSDQKGSITQDPCVLEIESAQSVDQAQITQQVAIRRQ